MDLSPTARVEFDKNLADAGKSDEELRDEKAETWGSDPADREAADAFFDVPEG